MKNKLLEKLMEWLIIVTLPTPTPLPPHRKKDKANRKRH